MSSRRKILFIAAVILQAAVLLSMIARQEILLKTGTKVMLKCVPVDPRSLFSGDYVILNYEISTIKSDQISGGEELFSRLSEKDTVFVALEKNRDNHFYSVTDVSTSLEELKNKHSIVIKGRVDDIYRSLNVLYGIENYFVPQKEGKDIESDMAEVSAEVSVAEDGRSALSRLFIAGKEVKFY